jgi:DNA-binding NtrC family response regulator
VDDAAYFVVFDKDSARRLGLPTDGEILIGRGEAADLRLSDSSVSRKHAKLVVRGGAARIVDLGSHNGVGVNGVRVSGEEPLGSGDVITLGKVTLVYEARGAYAETATVISETPTPPAVVRRVDLDDGAVLLADPVMVRMYQLLERLAAGDGPILIGGEAGTGKSLAAAAVHRFSPRARRPLVAIDCTSEQLDPARAGGGTALLDDVDALTPAEQAALLRLLEARPVDVRVVATTRADLETLPRDLYFRLGAATVWLPPLRARRREISLLADAFLEESCRRLGRPAMVLAPATIATLLAHDWPDNVRELRQTMETVAATTVERVVRPVHLPGRPAARGDATTDAPVPALRPLDDELRSQERRRLEDALRTCGGDPEKAADLLGMPRRAFAAKLRLYRL